MPLEEKIYLSEKRFSGRNMTMVAVVVALLSGIYMYNSFADNPNLPGDINNDNKVDITDMSLLLSAYGSTNTASDLNDDGIVNVLDLSILLTNYNRTYTSPTPPPTPTPTPPPLATGTMYGTPWYASSLGNIEIGKNGQTYSYGFNSLYSGQTSTLQFYLIYRAAGYFAGNGGQIKVELTTDNGGKPGTVLASYLITKPMAENFPKVPLSASLTAGQRYWIKFSNPAPDAANNWVSVDDLYASNQIPPGSSTQNLVALQNSSQNTNHIPVFTLTMSDGKTQGGPGYIDCPSRYDGASGATITITPKADRQISNVYARLSGSGTVTASLNGKTGSATIVNGGWTTIPLSTTLARNTNYNLTLTGSLTIEALQKGTPQGFADPFPDGHAVVSGRTDIDYPIYFK